MFSRIILIALVCLLTACVKQDAHYYWQHPDKLQAVLSDCPSKHPQDIDCDTLSSIQQSMFTLARELQKNPQDFGKSIIVLQEKISTIKSQLKNKPNDESLGKTLIESQKELDQRMAVVRWLESPRGT